MFQVNDKDNPTTSTDVSDVGFISSVLLITLNKKLPARK